MYGAKNQCKKQIKIVLLGEGFPSSIS